MSEVGRLARYLLIPRVAAPVLTLVALRADPPAVALLLGALSGLNLLALRFWTRLPHGRLHLLLDQVLALGVLGVVGSGTPMVLYLMASGVLAGLTYRARPVLVAGILTSLTYGGFLMLRAGYVPGEIDLHTTITLPALLLGAGPAGVAVRRLLVRQERTATQLWKLRRTHAVREERLRVARDLHDSLTKDLHGVWLLSRTLRAALERGDQDSVREAAGVIGETAQGLAGQSRMVIRGLRESGPAVGGLVEALHERAAGVSAGHQLAVEIQAHEVDLDDASRNVLLMVASEALHNVVKHARARTVTLTLAARADAVVLEIEDDGVGFAITPGFGPGHYGLLGMRERAARSGGEFAIRSAPGDGTRVRLTLPVRRSPVPARGEAFLHRARVSRA
ncbi:sensor histidine kinase [Kineosporia succinea]|uniref:Signal transduction histidine kinase n=1 Tax=Kineosporia succinea TaxID=84632 RepID=A0ABT9P1Q0_9ACTN|nr:sensor histidine kinase [Kineosporia succinea]MDP9826603.1 signal transduction histidine kinase [Kineosporia succinea]